MSKHLEIRSQFHPIQPSLRATDEEVIYREIIPSVPLQPFIYCYWQLQSTQTLAKPFAYQVVSDACIDIFFDLNNYKDSFVMGFNKSFVTFPIGINFNYVGIRFLPAMFPLWFDISAANLANRLDHLHKHLPAFAEYLIAETEPQDDLNQLKPSFDFYLEKILSQSNFDYDERFFNALHLILEKKGILGVSTDLVVGLSPRQLRRIFQHYIGVSAKSFAKVVRFQLILNAKPSMQSLRESKLFYDGYFDQAHFIKDFKQFYGLTPSQAFKR